MEKEPNYWALFGVIAAGVFAALLALDELRNYRLRNSFADITKDVAKAFSSPSVQRQQQLNSSTPRAEWIPPRQVSIPVAADTVSNCLRQTHDLVNEEFAKCRRGYSYTITTDGRWSEIGQ